MLFAEGLKVTKCWIASIFFAVASRTFTDVQRFKSDDRDCCVTHCGLWANNPRNNSVACRVLARKEAVKGYTSLLPASRSFCMCLLIGEPRFCIRIKDIAWAGLLM